MYLISACLITYRPLVERIGRKSPFRKSTCGSRTTGNSVPLEDSQKGRENTSVGSRLSSNMHGFQRLEGERMVYDGKVGHVGVDAV